MAALTAFITLSLDGCHADAKSDISWAHNQDPEQQAFTNDNANGNVFVRYRPS